MSVIRDILKDNNFRFNRQFGQNFITDTNLLEAMVSDAGICGEDTVVEIGAGAGTLTEALAKSAKRVIAFEIDNNLRPVLAKTLEGYEDKVQVIFKDIMKVTDEELREIVGGEYKVVANLPYYITTPIIMRFLESQTPPTTLSVMVQKEVAQRLTAAPSSAEYGAITIAVDLVGDARITRIVKRDLFYPVPNVDSAVIRIDINRNKYGDYDITQVKKLISAAFVMRRKTLVNNLVSGYNITREEAESALTNMGLDTRIRGECLSSTDYIRLAKELNER